MTSINAWPTEPIVVTDDKFKETVQKYPVVVVDCWAPWCGPCIMVAPIIEELAKEYQGKIVFGKLNTDENPETMKDYNIMSIPTLLIFKSGKIVDRSIGALPREELAQIITKYL
ncbi:thioredoxin [[Eubacterium] cellulosolvens]